MADLPRARKSYSELPIGAPSQPVKPVGPERVIVKSEEELDLANEMASKGRSVSETVAAISQLSTGKTEDGELVREVAANPNTGFEHVFSVASNEAVYQDGAGSVMQGQAVAGTISQLLVRCNPSNRRDIVRRAYHHYKRDDLLMDLVNLKMDFTVMGLNTQVTQKSSLTEDEQALMLLQEKIDDVAIGIDLSKIVEDMARDYYVTDNIILYWHVDETSTTSITQDSDASGMDATNLSLTGIPGITNIAVLNSADVNYNNSIGQDILEVAIPKEVTDQIKRAIDQGYKVNKNVDQVTLDLIQQGIGKKWIQAVINNQNMVRLRAEDGDHWIVETDARRQYGLAEPSMQSIYVPLEIRRMLSEGEFSTALVMKHFIMLIKSGESIESGPLAGQTKNWLRKKDAEIMNQRFAQITRAMRAAVNHTFKIEFVFPPKEMFNEDKYKNCERRIFNWAGVIQSVFAGEGATHGAGYLGIRRMVAKLATGRRKISKVMSRFFAHPTIASRIGIKPGYRVGLDFDENVLKEPRQLLDEVKFLFDNSIGDQRTSARELGRNPDSLRTSKARCRREENDSQAWSSVGDQGKHSSVDKGGRPANDDTTVSDETRNQPPSGRKTENS